MVVTNHSISRAEPIPQEPVLSELENLPFNIFRLVVANMNLVTLRQFERTSSQS